MEERVEQIKTLVKQIIETNEEQDINWVLLSTILTPSNSSEQPIVRAKEVSEMLSLALAPSSHPKFRELVFKQLNDQMKYPGSSDFILLHPQFETILRAIDDPVESIASLASSILKEIASNLLQSKEYSQILMDIAGKEDQGFVRVYSCLFKGCENSEETLRLLIQNGWMEKFLLRMKLDENVDPLIMLNLLELEIELVSSLTKCSYNKLLWDTFESHTNDIIKALLSENSESIMMLDLLLPLLIRLLGNLLKLNLTIQKNTSIQEDFGGKTLKVFEKFQNMSNTPVLESIIVSLGNFSLSKKAQDILFNSPIATFYKQALYGSKELYLSFVFSLTYALKENPGTIEGTEFINHLEINNQSMEIILKYAQTPFINERQIIYQLFEQLAAIRLGREILYSTNGLLLWLTDRSLIIEPNPEALWRYSILQQLVAIPEHCREKLGDNGYLRIREYLSQGEYYTAPEYRVAIADDFED